ncbi:MAG: AAA family ATPase [Acidimicrobiaceae bacterium]|nr:AAA family ATPase [Acidimicrobiaceae bacterium]MYL05106.1 AAA family ATPase [Acidimicrobiaceae bacterium]
MKPAWPSGAEHQVLTELAVRNLGVIGELSLVLDTGMTAVTGETGAGKTLVVEAIDLLTGGRADAALVRPGASEAEIEGRFVAGRDEVVVRRVVPADGRSRAYIDGHLATVGALAELGGGLIDLHGQHTHQSLLRAPVQRAALDRFGAIDTARLEGLIDDRRALDGELAAVGGDARARLREIDLLRHQVSEIDAAAIADPDEDGRLDRAESVLADAAAHREAAAAAVGLLDADSTVSEGLGQAEAALAGREPFTGLTARIAAASAEVADIAAEARALAEAIDDDPAALQALRDRRQLLSGLRRKYGFTLGEVLQFRSEAAARLAELEGHEDRAASLDRRLAEMSELLAAAQARVRARRAEAAPRLAAAVEAHLAELAMAGARLAVAVDGDAGEQVTFELAANPGHEPLPLSRVASGGELARAMLALRLVLTAGPPTLVFDEVDAGIGGTAAQAVGRSLARLGSDHQVIVVTHLPQVAAHADSHVVVEKSVEKHQVGGSAAVTLRALSGEDRLVELSRMLSGSPQSASARRHAEELLASSRPRRGS